MADKLPHYRSLALWCLHGLNNYFVLQQRHSAVDSTTVIWSLEINSSGPQIYIMRVYLNNSCSNLN